jgi:hypothetical protein
MRRRVGWTGIFPQGGFVQVETGSGFWEAYVKRCVTCFGGRQKSVFQEPQVVFNWSGAHLRVSVG